MGNGIGNEEVRTYVLARTVGTTRITETAKLRRGSYIRKVMNDYD